MPHTPDTVIEITGHPLSNDIASLVCFDKSLVIVHIDDISESLLLVWIRTELLGASIRAKRTFQALMIVDERQPGIRLDEDLDDEIAIAVSAPDRLEESSGS